MKLLNAGLRKIEFFGWGSLTWYASGELGNTEQMTLGQCLIKPGQENPRHHHPNCDEILHVLKGAISHSYGDEPPVEMHVGDTITIPPMVKHNAKNIGSEDAVLFIAFSSATRKTIGE